MAASHSGRGIAAVLVAAWLSGMGGGAGAAEPGAWSQRVQVLYDASARTVARATLRVWDAEPHRNLEFVWEPEPGSGFDPAATGGVVEGRGKLVWRVRGSAAYDRSAVYSTYAGEIRDGRPHGHGRLERRDGEVFEGEWVAGLLHGRGMHLDAAGNRYEGAFEAGRPHGSGRQAMADGSVYEGGFRDGLRHGEGRMRLAGGTAYDSTWQAGVETGGNRPDIAADAVVGGLLRAQSEGGEASRVDLSVVVDQRITLQSDLHYTHAMPEDRIEIYPLNPGMVDAWIGQAAINAYSYSSVFDVIDWSNAPVYLQVRFETRDGSRVRVDGLELQVGGSQVYRKPFLSTIGHWGCVGFRPSFSFQNNGWGGVRDARLTFEFFNRDDPSQASGSFETEVGSFDQGIDVTLREALDMLDVDTQALENARFTCPSEAELPQCRQQALASLRLGEIGSLLTGRADVSVGVRGRLAYQWADDGGNLYEQDEAFEESLQLAVIETELMVAEGGDGWGTAPEAPRYQTVQLPTSRQDYTVDLPVRGNRNLAAYTARLKVAADETSIHWFHAAARFADGSVRRSKPVTLFYVRPREYYHQPPEPETGCYIDPAHTPHRE